MSDSFVMYRSFHESLKELSREQYGNVMFAINEYALNGTETELSGVERAVFMLMKPQIDANNRRRDNGKSGGRPKQQSASESDNNRRSQKPMVIENAQEAKPMVSENGENEKPNHNLDITEPKPNVNANANGNVNDNANGESVPCGTRGFSCENPPSPPENHEKTAKKPPHFVKPSIDEVTAYCAERGNGIDARTFCDFYESKGWVVGNSRMKDWKACVRTWETRHRTDGTGGHVKRACAMWGNEDVIPQETINLIP